MPPRARPSAWFIGGVFVSTALLQWWLPDDVQLAIGLVCAIVCVGMLATRRVIIAWIVFLSLRWTPPYRRRASLRRWLWLRTLAEADGRRRRER